MQLQRGQFPYTDLSEVPDWYLQGLLGGTTDVKWSEMTEVEKQAVRGEVQRRQEVKEVKEVAVKVEVKVKVKAEPVVTEVETTSASAHAPAPTPESAPEPEPPKSPKPKSPKPLKPSSEPK